jgi:hypothetical protein
MNDNEAQPRRCKRAVRGMRTNKRAEPQESERFAGDGLVVTFLAKIE